MKKLLVVFSIFLLLTSCNETKIAYVDVEEVIKEYEGSKAAEKEMKVQSEEMATELDAMAREFQQKVQEYQSSSNSMSDKVKREREQVLMQEQQMIQQRQQMAQQQVQAEGQKMMDQINKEIETFLESYAKSEGYSYILGTSVQTKSVFYGDASLDVTEAVLSALNEGYKPENEEVKTEELVKKDTVN